jgi:hypothetical protein
MSVRVVVLMSWCMCLLLCNDWVLFLRPMKMCLRRVCCVLFVFVSLPSLVSIRTVLKEFNTVVV